MRGTIQTTPPRRLRLRTPQFSTGLIALLFTASAFAQTPTPQDVSAAIRRHFETVKPQLTRYQELASYGETLADGAISGQQLAQEVALFKDALAAGMLRAPADEVLSLGHNLIVHDGPASGKAYLTALHAAADPTDRRVGQAFVVATLAAGDWGEELAVAQLQSTAKARREFWAGYLAQCAIYPASLKPIRARLAVETESSIKVSLIHSLSMIGSPDALPDVRDVIERSADDDAVQAAALFAYAELAGFDALAYLEKAKPAGPAAARELAGGIEWLKKETRAESKHGRDVQSDAEFVGRFGDLRSPAIQWLAAEKLLTPEALKAAPKLDAAKKKRLLDLLIESKGFGLEAAKGTLFHSLARDDEPALLRIRAVSFHSPGAMSQGRMRTAGILIRHIRQEL